MNNSIVTQRVSKTSIALHLILTTLLGLTVGACAQGGAGDDIDTAGLRNLLGHTDSQSKANEPEGLQQDGVSLPAAPEEAAPAADEPVPAAAFAVAAVEEPAVVAAEEEPAVAEEASDEGVATEETSVVSRVDSEGAQVSTQSFSAGDMLAFGTHTQILPTGLVASGSTYFGSPVIVQGDRMVVGAWGDAEQAPQQGAVFVFERDAEGTWVQDIKLMASDADVEPVGDTWGACFGYTMAMDGDTLAIGAAWDDGDEGELDAGAVYVYDLVSENWVETKLRAPSQGAYEAFGDAVAVSGDWVFVHGRTGSEQLVHVFHRVDGTWQFSETLGSPDGTDQREFGTSLAAAGTQLFVAAMRAPGGDPDWANSEYSVYAFELSAGTWSQTQKLTALGNAPASGFGKLAFNGETLVVGAPYFSGAESYQGAAYVFEKQLGSWEQIAALTETAERAYGYFGYNVAVDGDSLGVATGYGDNADAVYVYERVTENAAWTLNQDVTVSDVVEAPHSGAPTFGLFGGQLFLGLPVGITDGHAVGAVYALTGE